MYRSADTRKYAVRSRRYFASCGRMLGNSYAFSFRCRLIRRLALGANAVHADGQFPAATLPALTAGAVVDCREVYHGQPFWTVGLSDWIGAHAVLCSCVRRIVTRGAGRGVVCVRLSWC